MDPARLDAIPAFAGLDSGAREQLAAAMREITVEAGATLAKEGDFAYELFAIEEGDAEVRKDGKLLRTLGTGDVFGEIALLVSGRRTATVVATSPMRLLGVFTREFRQIERRAPDAAQALRAVMQQRAAGTGS